jgi:SRSO17 transposase
MQAGARKNMDRMAEVVPGAKSRNLQQFLTHSRWAARGVMDHVARDADAELGHPREAGLLIDESGFVKQGRKSVGVSRQWLGRLGKVDNGQVAVFGALAQGSRVVPVDARRNGRMIQFVVWMLEYPRKSSVFAPRESWRLRW